VNDLHRSLFRKLNAAGLCFVGLVAAWLTLGASIPLVGLTLAAVLASAFVVGRELGPDVTP
jgi:hypothetical protein